jgi:hypothetical protein
MAASYNRSEPSCGDRTHGLNVARMAASDSLAHPHGGRMHHSPDGNFV